MTREAEREAEAGGEKETETEIGRYYFAGFGYGGRGHRPKIQAASRS